MLLNFVLFFFRRGLELDGRVFIDLVLILICFSRCLSTSEIARTLFFLDSPKTNGKLPIVFKTCSVFFRSWCHFFRSSGENDRTVRFGLGGENKKKKLQCCFAVYQTRVDFNGMIN